MASTNRSELLARISAGRVQHRLGYFEVPTLLFVEKVDVNQPSLPSIAFYVFKEDHQTPGPTLLREADQPYSALALSTHENVWIRDEDFPAIRTLSETLLTRPENGSSLTPEKRMEGLRKTAMLVVEDLFENPSPENIKKSTQVVSSFVYVLMKDPKAYLLLSKLSSHDPYTLQHSVGTAVNCIILARKSGISDEQELSEVGLAGLLHDIGKVRIKKEIINKNGPLDEDEWEEMRQHSEEGYNLVKDNPDLSLRTKLAILEHHEDKLGKGYPLGKKTNEVDAFSKIVCICDIFNALTTNRSYSKARTPFEALQFMRDNLVHKVDEELFKCLVLVYGGRIEG